MATEDVTIHDEGDDKYDSDVGRPMWPFAERLRMDYSCATVFIIFIVISVFIVFVALIVFIVSIVSVVFFVFIVFIVHPRHIHPTPLCVCFCFGELWMS